MRARRSWIWATSSLGSVVTKANVSRYVPSGRFRSSQMPGKANGPGSVRVMLKTRLMGLAVFAFRAGFGAEPKRSPEAAALGEGLTPHLAVGQPVRFGIDYREFLEFELTLGEPRHNAPTHHHQLALSGVAAAANDGLGVTGRDVVVRRDDADVVRGAAHIEVLGHLLLVEEAVVATAHSALHRPALMLQKNP